MARKLFCDLCPLTYELSRWKGIAFRHLQDLMSSVKPEGLGLGLSIVRGIADSHGAGLSFERNPEGGLTVRFTTDAFEETMTEKNV